MRERREGWILEKIWGEGSLGVGTTISTLLLSALFSGEGEVRGTRF